MTLQSIAHGVSPLWPIPEVDDLLKRIIPEGSEEALAREWAKLPETKKSARDCPGETSLQDFSAKQEDLCDKLLPLLVDGPKTSAELSKMTKRHANAVATLLGKMSRHGFVDATRISDRSTVWSLADKGRARL